MSAPDKEADEHVVFTGESPMPRWGTAKHENGLYCKRNRVRTHRSKLLLALPAWRRNWLGIPGATTKCRARWAARRRNSLFVVSHLARFWRNGL